MEPCLLEAPDQNGTSELDPAVRRERMGSHAEDQLGGEVSPAAERVDGKRSHKAPVMAARHERGRGRRRGDLFCDVRSVSEVARPASPALPRRLDHGMEAPRPQRPCGAELRGERSQYPEERRRLEPLVDEIAGWSIDHGRKLNADVGAGFGQNAFCNESAQQLPVPSLHRAGG